MKHLLTAFLLCAATSLASAQSKPSKSADFESIEPGKKTGTAMATVVEPAPLAHTTQFLPVTDAGEIIGRGDTGKQASQVLKRLSAALQLVDSDLDRIVKLNVYVRTNSYTDAVTKVLAKTFNGRNKPAVTIVGGALIHPDALVSMDAVAICKDERAANGVKKYYPANGGDKTTADVAILDPKGVVYVAGMADKSELGEATRITLGKLHDAIAHLGLEKKDVVQLKAFMSPMTRVDVVRNEIMKFYGEKNAPAVVFVEWIPSSVPIEIEMIASDPMREDEVHPPQAIQYLTPPGTTASAVYSRLARISFGKRIYISGLYGTSTPENDVTDIYAKLNDLLKKTGSDINHLAKATYYFSDPKSNGRLDALRPKIYDPKRPPTASKVRVPDCGMPGQGIVIDMIGVEVSKKP